MKTDSWATATNRWVRAADRLSATFSRQTMRRPGLPLAYQLTARGFQHGHDVGDGPDCGWWWNLDGGKHGGGVAGGNHAYHRYADRI